MRDDMKSFFKRPSQLGILVILSTGLMACGAVNFSSFAELLPSLSSSVSSSPLDASTLLILENKIYQQVNQYRQSRGLPLLLLNRIISQQARLHSQRMATGLVPFSHQGFEERAQTIGFSIPYQSVGENVAVNQGYDDPVKVAVDGWIKSKGHRENMQGNFDSTGIGVATDNQGKIYLTQIFLKRQSAPVSTNLIGYDPILNQSFLITLEENTNYQVNRYRISQNLSPLRLDSRISNEARLFSQKMANKKAPFSHDGFERRMKAVQAMIPLQKMGENLAFMKGYSDPVTVAVQGWINSPGHQKNMVGDYNLTGIGIAKNSAGEYYFTQLFVKKR
jgi:uncharacterized protein YkwD